MTTCQSNQTRDAATEADRRWPRRVAMSGAVETASRRAFVAGAKWAEAQVADEIRAVRLALIPGKYAPGHYAGLAQAERIARGATP